MNFSSKINICNKEISNNSYTFIIGEAGVNHNGSLELAKKLIDLAFESGLDAVKFQAFKSEDLILKNVEKAPYQKETTGKEESQLEMLRKLEVTKETISILKKYSEEKGIGFLVTPFDEKSLDELDELGLEAFKISSTDVTNLPFLRKVALKNKPIILSTGMTYLKEIEMALAEIYEFNKEVILLHCTANYPVPAEEVNLNVFHTLKSRFDILLGYSDHTEGVGASPYAIPMGAKVIEKHFTLDKNMNGPDHRASLGPAELKLFVEEIRKAEKYMGSAVKEPQDSELHTRKSLQKSFVARKNIDKGEVFGDDNVVAKRCGGKGISPVEYKKVFGQVSPKNFKANEIINL